MASQVQMRLAKPRSRCDFVNLVVGHLGQAGEDIFHKGVVKGAVLDIVHYAARGPSVMARKLAAGSTLRR